MSGGGILLVPVALVLAAGALVVIGAAAAAYLTVRAANAAAEGAVRAIGNYGRALECQVAGQSEAAVNAARWEITAADVVELNARIRMTAERASRAGVAVALPEPLTLPGRTVPDVIQWLAHAAHLLAVAQQTLYDTALRNSTVELPASREQSSMHSEAADAMARYQRMLRERLVIDEIRPAVDADQIASVLTALDPDAGDEQQVVALRLATLARHDDDGAGYLMQLQAHVQTVNAELADVRLMAQILSALEEPTVARVDPPPLADTKAKLRSVVAGTSTLTPQLRAEALEAAAWAEAVARQNLIRQTLRACFAEQGYSVDGEFDTRHTVGLRLSRSDWRGENSAQIVIDEDGSVRGTVKRHIPALQGEDARLRNQSRCDDFNRDLEAVGRRLDAMVVIDHGHIPEYEAPAVPIQVDGERPQTAPLARQVDR